MTPSANAARKTSESKRPTLALHLNAAHAKVTSLMSASSSASDLKERGNAALKEGNAKEALRLYTEALEKVGVEDELASVLHSNVSAVQGRLGDWEAALAAAQRCVALRPTWPKAHVRVGASSYGVGKFGEAVAAYTEALRLAPDDEAVQAALEDAQKAKSKKELDASLMPAVMEFAQRKQKGTLLLQQKQYAQAAAEYRGALASMSTLLDRMDDAESSPLKEQLLKLRRAMEAELLAATQAQANAAMGVEPGS